MTAGHETYFSNVIFYILGGHVVRAVNIKVYLEALCNGNTQQGDALVCKVVNVGDVHCVCLTVRGMCFGPGMVADGLFNGWGCRSCFLNDLYLQYDLWGVLCQTMVFL